MDTQSHRDTFPIARLAAGASIMAAESAWNNRKPSIALVRPPGHHAIPDLAMGFCYLNNIAIAAKKLLDRTKRIAIVDIDVHHGNGTQDIFYDSRDVLYISTHQKWIFPGTGNFNETGIGEGRGYTVNIPINSEAGDATFLLAHEKIVLPVLQEFNPEIILVSIGTDSHYKDPLATLTLSSEGFAKEIDGLLGYAKKNCNDRIAFFLEGGYDLDALAEVISHTVGQFEGKNTPMKFIEIFDKEAVDRESIIAITQAHKEYWSI